MSGRRLYTDGMRSNQLEKTLGREEKEKKKALLDAEHFFNNTFLSDDSKQALKHVINLSMVEYDLDVTHTKASDHNIYKHLVTSLFLFSYMAGTCFQVQASALV